MTQHTASNSIVSNLRTRRVAGLAALAVLGLPLGAVLAPSTASAAPGDPIDGLDTLDGIGELPFDGLPFEPAFVPTFPIFPLPELPEPELPEPEVPGPDDGPVPVVPTDFGPLITLPDLEIVPLPDDWFVNPDDDDDGEEPEPEPECAEYSAAHFGVVVDRYDDDLIEVALTYTDPEVCEFTVWSAIAVPGADDVLASTTVGMDVIASQTGDDLYYQQTFSDHDLCDLEIRIAVEESLAMIHPFTDPGCETPEEGEAPGEDDVPGDDDDVPGDDDDVPGDDDDVPGDDDDVPGDDDDVPGDDDDVPGDDDEVPGDDETPDGAPLEDDEPIVPGGSLPQTGTDLTTVMLAIGLMTLGAGSIVALATRRREDLPIV